MNVSSKHFNYCFFPREVLSDARLSPNDTIVYLGILSITDNISFTCEFTYAELRKKIGYISRSTILRSIKNLKNFKFLEVKRKRNYCKYTILNKDHIKIIN